MRAWLLPSSVLATVVVSLLATATVPGRRASSAFDLAGAGRLPVSANGRVQPFDSVARVGLLQIRSSSSVPFDDGRVVRFRAPELSATEWLLELLTKPDAADGRRIFPIADRGVVTTLQLPPAPSRAPYYAFRDLGPKIDEIARQARRIGKLKPALRAPWEHELLRLRARLVIYERLKNSIQPNSTLQQDAHGKPVAYDFAKELATYRLALAGATKVAIRRQHGSTEQLDAPTEEALRAFARPFQGVSRAALIAFIPPGRPAESRDRWRNVGAVVVDSARTGQLPMPVAYVAAMSSAYAQGKADVFNAEVARYTAWLEANGLGPERRRAGYELFFNALQPFVRAFGAYLIGAGLLCAAWWERRPAAYRSALLVLVLAFALHTLGLLFDVMLTGQLPLGNRYSLTIFGGWLVVFAGLVVEPMRRSGLALAVGTAGAIAALIAAHGLAAGGAASLVEHAIDWPFVGAFVATGAIVWASRRIDVASSRPGAAAAA